jgi:glycosyltransferase involved in cell wall biosynthesis
MIVKNEEKVLGNCLRTIRDHVDEIIIVDTGSTDGTVAIAESFGARVFHHPWEDHFSKHRNQSLSYSRSDWNLIIDADEELCLQEKTLLRRYLSAGEEVDAIAVMVECPFGEKGGAGIQNAIRILRNHRRICYKGRVHNYLSGVVNVLCSQIRIYHHGYVLDRETQLRRFRRTTTLLRKDIEEDPFNPRPHHYLAVSYLSEHMNAEAVKEAEEAIRLFEEGKMELPIYLWALYIASSGSLEMGDLENAKAWATKGLHTHPDHLDSVYLLAVISYRSGDHDGFQAYLARYRETKRLIEKDPVHFGEMVHNTYTSGWILDLLEAILCMEGGRHEEARRRVENARSTAPDPLHFHSCFGKLLVQSGRYPEGSEEIRKGLELRPDDKDLLWTLSYACERQGKTMEQLSCIEKLMDLDPGFPNAAFQAGLASMRLGRFRPAREFFLKARSQNPDNRLARINEVLCLRGMGEYEESIRLSMEVEPESVEEHRTLLLNRACCHDSLGHRETAVESFHELEQKAPEALEPPVYLSLLFLRKGDVESCVAQCDRLLKLLGIRSTITLQSLSELAALYLQAAGQLSGSLQRADLSAVCTEIGLFLGRADRGRFPGSA